MNPEILAPVGGEEQLRAAVRAGADAVYMGTKAFNARRGAENFDEASLKEAVSYCRARGVRVHVTLNTLITDKELEQVKNVIKAIAKSGADAVIVQDLAVLRLLRECCPDISLHASTQMTLHNIAGVKQAAELGFSRAVLARELELSEIKSIAASGGIETEVFLHGALCTSLSGACYLSSVIGGRSGNRGRCAQPCRLDFRTDDGIAYALSLKDMSYIAHIRELAEAGVRSFKIEGRLKRPEYVACAVKAARDALEGKTPDMDTLRSVFSRGGFTDGHLAGKRREMFGVREKEADEGTALARTRELYRNERQCIPVDMRLACSKKSTLCITDGKLTASVMGEPPQEAQAAALDEERAKRSLEKLGGTPFYLRALEIDIDSGLMLPQSQLNAMRRSAAEQLMKLRGETREKRFIDVPVPMPKEHVADKPPLLRARFESASQLCEDMGFDSVILPAKEVIGSFERLKHISGMLIAELPAVIFEKDMPDVSRTLDKLIKIGVTDVYAENIGALRAARERSLAVHGGHGLNILNSVALEEYRAMGLTDALFSFELNAAAASRLRGSVKRGAIGYGYLPLMRFRACQFGRSGCGGCEGVRTLTDRTGASFTVLCHERRYTTLLNSLPLYIGDKSIDNVDYYLLYFTTETAERVKRVTGLYKVGLPFDKARTNGLYFRTLE